MQNDFPHIKIHFNASVQNEIVEEIIFSISYRIGFYIKVDSEHKKITSSWHGPTIYETLLLWSGHIG